MSHRRALACRLAGRPLNGRWACGGVGGAAPGGGAPLAVPPHPAVEAGGGCAWVAGTAGTTAALLCCPPRALPASRCWPRGWRRDRGGGGRRPRGCTGTGGGGLVSGGRPPPPADPAVGCVSPPVAVTAVRGAGGAASAGVAAAVGYPRAVLVAPWAWRYSSSPLHPAICLWVGGRGGVGAWGNENGFLRCFFFLRGRQEGCMDGYTDGRFLCVSPLLFSFYFFSFFCV